LEREKEREGDGRFGNFDGQLSSSILLAAY
jgi:hypothetical protein